MRVKGTDFDLSINKDTWTIVDKNEQGNFDNYKFTKFKFGKLRKLFLEITDKCNYNCIHCYNKPFRLQKELTYEEITQILNTINEKYILETIQITGGEPLLHKDIFKIVNLSKKFAKNVEIFTNGSLLSKLTDKKPNFNINVSFYSFSKEKYQKITQTKIDPTIIAENILKLKENGWNIKVAIPIIPKYNEKDFKITKKYFEDNKIKVSGSLIIAYGAAKSEKITKQKNPPIVQTNFKDILKVNLNYNECFATHLAIDTDQNAYPCIFAREYLLGNLKKDKINIILKNHKAIAKKFAPDNLKICKNCAFRYVCKRCPPRAKAYGVLGIKEAFCPL